MLNGSNVQLFYTAPAQDHHIQDLHLQDHLRAVLAEPKNF